MTEPKFQWTNARGEVVCVFATEDPNRFRTMVDGKPLDLNKAAERGGTK